MDSRRERWGRRFQGWRTAARWVRVGQLLAAGIVPILVAESYVPFRAHIVNVDIALVLVVTVMGIGLLGRHIPALVGATSAALSFATLDTRPYFRLAVADRVDLQTTIVLSLVGLLAAESSIRFVAARHRARAETERLTSMRDAAAMLATGQEVVTIVVSIADEIRRLLGLSSCRYEASNIDMRSTVIDRDGTLSNPWADSRGPLRFAELPVWSQGEVIGHFELVFSLEHQEPDPQALTVAVALADQVGAAFTAYAPSTPPPDEGDHRVRLRLIGGTAHAGSVAPRTKRATGSSKTNTKRARERYEDAERSSSIGEAMNS